MNTAGKLASKVAIVTGSGAGIGRAAALMFAREGASVVVAEINGAAGDETAHEITAAGGKAISVRTDVTDQSSVEAVIAEARKAFGGLHVLYNNAGGSTLADSTVVDAPIDEFWRAIKLDLFGTFLACRFGIPEIARSGGGSVINMSSAVAFVGIPNMDCYTASKGGVTALTRSLAVEFAPQNIRVNAISPGLIMTERTEKMIKAKQTNAGLANQQPLGAGQPNDIAAAALYLASDDSRLVTGTILKVDSGLTSFRG